MYEFYLALSLVHKEEVISNNRFSESGNGCRSCCVCGESCGFADGPDDGS